MPIYEFRCERCKDAFEEYFRSASERRKLICPGCGSAKVRKILSVFGVGSKRESGSTASAKSCSSCRRTSCAGCK